mmetsp:Transcript_11440/g.19017  ORF Transcript_11440/g.19017 Transcript_11440/m.19017 type:complete len:199 (-) Transcript_11440:367-963(-)
MTTVPATQRSRPIFLQSNHHPLAPWINGLLVVELTSRLIQQNATTSIYPDGLLTFLRTILWGILVIQLAWRCLCQYSSLWWILDYVPTSTPPSIRDASLWVLSCPERCIAGAVNGLCSSRGSGESRVGVSSWFVVIRGVRQLISKMVGLCLDATKSIMRIRETSTTAEDELLEGGMPLQELIEREMEMIDVSRHSKHE